MSYTHIGGELTIFTYGKSLSMPTVDARADLPLSMEIMIQYKLAAIEKAT